MRLERKEGATRALELLIAAAAQDFESARDTETLYQLLMQVTETQVGAWQPIFREAASNAKKARDALEARRK